MGDLIELTTWPNEPHHQNVFYKVTDGAFSFEVKASGSACIGFAKKPGRNCDLQITLGQRRSWIKVVVPGGAKKTVETPNILSPDEYRRFWIKWYGGEYVCVGRDGQTNAIIICNCKMPNLKYVTFYVIEDNRNPVHWRFEAPPLLKKPKLKPIVDGDLHWVQVDANNPFPDDALIGGFEKENLYIIRAPHSGSLTPGKFASSQGSGFIGWSWEAHEKSIFEVLCGFDCKWVPTSHNKIPVGAVVGGQSENAQQEKLYIGRVKHMGHIIPGKVQCSHDVCFVAYDGKEIGQDKYEILVHTNKMHNANKLLVPHVGVSQDSDEEDEDDNDDDYEDHQNIMMNMGLNYHHNMHAM